MNLEEFNIFFNKYYQVLCRAAFNHVNDSPLAEEIASDSFLAIWNNLPRFLTQRDAANFLFATMRNKCINSLVRKNRHKEYCIYNMQTDQTPDYNLVEIGALVNVELMELFAKFVDRRVVGQRLKIAKLFMAGRTPGEIADIMGVTVKTIYNQRLIVFARFKKWLNDENKL
jgi:RNA polymerase sigma factor (sigma-70 family)